MTDEDEANFEAMNHCHICGNKYTDKDVRVIDHCHITGKFRCSAHQECSLKLRIKDLEVPVIFHNLRGYDSHFIMQQIGEIAKKHAYTNKKEKSKTSISMPSLITWKNIWLSCSENTSSSLITFNL